MSAKTYNMRTAGKANIPVLGLGTWQSTGQDCVAVVKKALEMGYEHIDTAEAFSRKPRYRLCRLITTALA
ncbi:2,5-diketo-D-gluconic acid reductase [Streptococcus pneumoniae]|nr:2,5-diketo-D-gluconic acid reductase [Streptococcus pneumoniae]